MSTFYPNVVYKTIGDIQLAADVYAPVPRSGIAVPPSPALFWIHGGGWSRGNRDQILPLKRFMRLLRRAGVTLVTFSYRLAKPGQMWPCMLHDCVDGVKYFIKNADKFNIDASNIVIGGASAGAQLSLLTTFLHDRCGEVEALKSVGFKPNAILDACGPVMLFDPRRDMSANSPIAQLLGGAYNDIPEVYHMASPLWVVQNKKNAGGYLPPIYAPHGELDMLVSPEQPAAMKEVYTAAGGDMEILWVQNSTHEFQLSPLGDGPLDPDRFTFQKLLADFVIKHCYKH